MAIIDTRNTKRDSLFLLADVVVDGALGAERVKVRNLSNSGIMIEGPMMVSRGQRVRVSINKVGDVGGVVAWTQGTRAGVSFDEDVDAQSARVSLVGDMAEAPRYARPAVRPVQYIGAQRSL